MCKMKAERKCCGVKWQVGAVEEAEEVAKVTEMLTDERGGGKIISHYKLRGSRMRHEAAAAAAAAAELMTSCPARLQLPPPQPCSSFRPAIHGISKASRPSASPAVSRESSKRGRRREAERYKPGKRC